MKKQFDTIYAVAKSGKVKEYTVTVNSLPDDTAEIVSVYGYVHGQMQTAVVKVLTGKNIGKINETTPFEQAVNQAQSKFNKKLDEGYGYNIDDAIAATHNTSKDGYVKPMLANKYKESKVVFPVYAQPKLDGMRCTITRKDDKIIYVSRKGKLFSTLEHLTPSLSHLKEGEIIDGEVYIHGVEFNELSELIKKEREESKALEFHMYDMIYDAPFKDRTDVVGDFCNGAGAGIIDVETVTLDNAEDVVEYHEQCLAKGYEGIMIRNAEGKYEMGFRSQDLMKYKHFDDAEFEIVGGYEGEGRFEGCCTFKVKNEEGAIFSACPKGTLEKKKWYWDNLESLIGKQLTVQYFGRSKDNIPRFPVGIAIRDYE